MRIVCCCILLLTLQNLVRAEEPIPEKIEFNRDVRPILSDVCFQCHGPDSAQRKAELRLDREADVFAERDGHKLIVPGQPAQSELLRRIATDDADERMPPADSGKSLSKRQIAIVERWIAQGATWQKHWSLIAPVRPQVPEGPAGQHPIDAFVQARLAREGMKPAAEADKETLLRRVSLDLTGLPPTLAEIDSFLADASPGAYEAVVDRLLKSPRFGERMAARWLDGARYADTNGYQSDGERHMWRYRDWVIDAYNSNMPFDRFTIEQLAGDLLPEPTLEQRIATAFNRNHRGNAEGGIIPEEYAVEYVVDRVETTSTVWMGLTLGCCRCHSHKFDPFSQKDFYRLFAFFNNVPERGRAVKFGNSPPMMSAPTREQQKMLASLDERVAAAEREFRTHEGALPDQQQTWERTVAAGLDWTITGNLVAQFDLNGDLVNRAPPVPPRPSAATINGEAPKPVPTEREFDGDAAFGAGKIGKGAEFDGKRFIRGGDIANFSYLDAFSASAWINPRGATGTIVSRMADKPDGDGWSMQLANGKLQANFVKRWLDDSLRIESAEALPLNEWHHVLFTYDGSRTAEGVFLYVDGQPVKMVTQLDALNQEIQTSEPLRIGGGNGPEGRFQGLIDDVRVYGAVLTPDEVAVVATAESISNLAQVAPGDRKPGQVLKLRGCFLDLYAPEAIRTVHRQLQMLRKEREKFILTLPTVMVMVEMESPKPAWILLRGEYDKHGEPVTAGVPEDMPPLEAGLPVNRLGLAKWLVAPTHPLTARVMVNRFWQMYFGSGLVRTMEDFGSQGDWPSHPEMLDWLATEFIRTGWDVKAMQKLIVTSSTYRQSSRVTAETLHRDPENRLLARGPRFRLSAQAIRDQALFVSGLLTEQQGGPSVIPYQPEGLYKDLSTLTDYPQSHGPDLYRRSLYTYWKRTVANPTMMTFDASSREACVVRETRTNTPLQALTLLNEVTFVEASRKLAERAMMDGGATPAERLTHAFRLATSRAPRPAELALLTRSLSAHQALYAADREAAEKLLTVGEAPRNPQLDVAEFAAYTAIANMILNLDEVVTRQ